MLRGQQPIDPRLMAADYSGIAEAGRIRGAAMANLGKSIGEAIKGYTALRDEEDNKRKFAEKIAKGKNSFMLEFLGFEPGDTKNITADEIYNVIIDMDAKKVQDLDTTFFVLDKKQKAEEAKARIEAGKLDYTPGSYTKLNESFPSNSEFNLVKENNKPKLVYRRGENKNKEVPQSVILNQRLHELPGYVSVFGEIPRYGTGFGNQSGISFLGFE